MYIATGSQGFSNHKNSNATLDLISAQVLSQRKRVSVYRSSICRVRTTALELIKHLQKGFKNTVNTLEDSS